MDERRAAGCSYAGEPEGQLEAVQGNGENTQTLNRRAGQGSDREPGLAGKTLSWPRGVPRLLRVGLCAQTTPRRQIRQESGSYIQFSGN